MTKFAYGAMVASGVTAVALGLAPAVAAMPTPMQPGTVQETVDQLEADGFKVILNKVGSAGRRDCSVTAVRPGQTYVRTDSGVAGAMGDYIVTTLSKTVYVDVMC